MRKNLLITTILLLAIMPMVLAATSMSVPATGGNYSTTLNLAVTVDANGANNMTNVTCYYNATGGATGTYLTQILNDSVYDLSFTSAVDISSLADLLTYNISCKVQNGTSLNTTLYASSVGIDNTAPTCSASRAHAKPAYQDLQDVIWASADATSGLTSTAVTIDRPGSGADMTYTDASRTLQLTSQDTKFVGDWTATVLATDKAGNTNTCTTTWKTYLPDGVTAPAGSSESSNKGILILVVIGVIAFFIFKGK